MAGEPRAAPTSRWPWIVAGGAMVVLVVVAAGGGLPTDVGDGVADGSDVAVRVLIGAVAGAALGAVVLVAIRRAGGAARLGLAGATAAALAIVTVAALGATASVATAPLHPASPSVDVIESDGPTDAPARQMSSAGESRPTELPGWLEVALIVVAVVASLIILSGLARSFPGRMRRRHGLLGRRNRREADAVFEDIDLAAAADVFDRAAALPDGDDPRAVIIAAYARLLDGLGDVGCARRPDEAPEEHLRRSLVTLGVESGHMRVVVDRFLVARFSTHPLTSADAADVRAALRAVGTQLRAATRQLELASAAST
jgi:hypothetical protein